MSSSAAYVIKLIATLAIEYSENGVIDLMMEGRDVYITNYKLKPKWTPVDSLFETLVAGVHFSFI